MKIVIDGSVLELTGPGRVEYDPASGTLSLGPLSAPPKAQRLLSPPAPRQLTGPATKPSAYVSKAALKEKILDLVREGNGSPVGTMQITLQTVGKGADPKKQRYLKLLLEQMVAAGQLVSGISPGHRKQYSFPN